MEKKAHFTNEELSKKFKSNFDLVNYAIKLAENMIRTGRDARVKSEIQNRAMLILEEIEEGKDQFDEVKETKDRAVLAEGDMSQQKLVFEEHVEKRKFRTLEGQDEE